MAIGLLATITVREGMNEEFEKAFWIWQSK